MNFRFRVDYFLKYKCCGYIPRKKQDSIESHVFLHQSFFIYRSKALLFTRCGVESKRTRKRQSITKKKMLKEKGEKNGALGSGQCFSGKVVVLVYGA